MTLVTGTVQDLGYDGMEGTLWARPARFRSEGQVVYAPERKPYTITGGVVSADLAPGPAVLELQVGSHARGSFEVVIPEEDITLADLLDTAFVWEPEQVSLFVAERKAAEQAAAEAEAAAGQAVTAAGTATTAAQQTGQDRSHVDQVRALLDDVYDESQAGMALPPRLAEAALNATYAPREGSAVYASKSEVASLIEVELDGSTAASVEPTPDALAKRTGTGSVRVPDPLANLDAANRQWALAEISGSIGPLMDRVATVEDALSTTSALEGMVLTITSSGPGWRFPADSYQTVYTLTYP